MRDGWMRRDRVRSTAGEAPDPAAVALAGAVLELLGPPELWAVYTVPGPHHLRDCGARQRRRDRWWRHHVAAVGNALRLTDRDAIPRAVDLAVEVVVACALARDRGVVVPAEVTARRGWPDLRGRTLDLPRQAGVDGDGSTALAVLLSVLRSVDQREPEAERASVPPHPRAAPGALDDRVAR